MKNIISNKGTMTSLMIAEITGKHHYNVMKAIRNMEDSWVNLGQVNFNLSSYTNDQNREMPMYELTKTECLYIATKFSDTARGKLVIRWEELEKNQIDFTDPNTILKLAQDYVKEHELRVSAENKVKELQPKADFMDRVMDSDQMIDVGQAAKILELPFGRNTMFKQLREKGIFFKNKNEPKQEYINRKYFVVKEKYISRNNHEGFVVVKTLVTQRGLDFLSKTFSASKAIVKLAKLN